MATIKLKLKKGHIEVDVEDLEIGSHCKACSKRIYWGVTKKNKKPIPVSQLGDGSYVAHFFDCPGAKDFRK